MVKLSSILTEIIIRVITVCFIYSTNILKSYAKDNLVFSFIWDSVEFSSTYVQLNSVLIIQLMSIRYYEINVAF